MFGYARDFGRARSGSMMPVFIIILTPLLLAVGFSVDYTSAVETKSNMQNALDAAILSITTLPTTTKLADREISLQQAFAANGGQGTAKLDSFVVAADGTATATASAHYPMPTNFMQIARIETVQVGVDAAVRKRPTLVQTTFRVTKVSGYWNKTMTLYGTKFGDKVAKPLMTITYTYNNFGDPKGYGTSIVSTINGSTTTKVQQQVCTTATVKNFNNLPSGAITQSSGSKKYVTTCADTFYPSNGAGAVIDVSQMDNLYLQMDVPSGSPKVLKSNDPTTSNRLYVGTSTSTMPEIATGQTVDIFTAVPCGQTGYQAWEDGGNPVPADVSNADFFYTVQGKCDFNQRPSNTVLTQ